MFLPSHYRICITLTSDLHKVDYRIRVTPVKCATSNPTDHLYPDTFPPSFSFKRVVLRCGIIGNEESLG